MGEYGPKATRKIEQVMHEFEAGTLKSSTGQKVTDRSQAVAISIAEARKAGYKVPKES